MSIIIKQEDNNERKAMYKATFPYRIKEPETNPFRISQDLETRLSNIFSIQPSEKCLEEHSANNWELQYNRRYTEWSEIDQRLQMQPAQQARENSWRIIFESTFRELSKRRGDNERQIRRVNRTKSEYLRVLSEDGDFEKVRRNAAVIPPLVGSQNIVQRSSLCREDHIRTNVALLEKKRLNDFVRTWNDVDINMLRHCMKIVGKNFGSIAMHFPERTVKDCIQCYYLLIKRDNEYKAILPKTKKKTKAKYHVASLPTPAELSNFQRFRNDQEQIMRNQQIHAQLQAQVAQVQAQARVLANTQSFLLNRHLSNTPHSAEMQRLMEIQSSFNGANGCNIFMEHQGLYPPNKNHFEPVDVLAKFERLLREIDDFIEHWKFKKSMLAFIPRSAENINQINDYLTEHYNQMQLLYHKYEHSRNEVESFQTRLSGRITALKKKESMCMQAISLAKIEVNEISAVMTQLQHPYHPGFLLAFPSYQDLMATNLKHRSQLQSKCAALQAELVAFADEKRRIQEQIQKCAQLKLNKAYVGLDENLQYISALLSEVSFHSAH